MYQQGCFHFSFRRHPVVGVKVVSDGQKEKIGFFVYKVGMSLLNRFQYDSGSWCGVAIVAIVLMGTEYNFLKTPADDPERIGTGTAIDIT